MLISSPENTVGRCYGWPLYTLRRGKTFFQRYSFLIYASLNAQRRTSVVTRQLVKRAPGQGVPTGPIRSMAFHGLENKPSIK